MFSMALLCSARHSCTSAPVSLLREKLGAAINKHPININPPDTVWAHLSKGVCVKLKMSCVASAGPVMTITGKWMLVIKTTEERNMSLSGRDHLTGGINFTEYDTWCFGCPPQSEMNHSGRLSAAQSSLMDFSTRSEWGDEPKKRKWRKLETQRGRCRVGGGSGGSKVRSARVSCLLRQFVWCLECN